MGIVGIQTHALWVHCLSWEWHFKIKLIMSNNTLNFIAMQKKKNAKQTQTISKKKKEKRIWINIGVALPRSKPNFFSNTMSETNAFQ